MMEELRRHFGARTALSLALCACAFAAAAQTYPNRAIRLVVPFAPGGSTDVLARIMGQRMTESMGQAVIIDNKLGAGGVVGTEFAARQPADGYTLIMANAGSHAIIARTP